MSVKTFDECYLLNYDTYEDLSLYEVGCQKCPPSYGYGPIIRETYILHYILSGEGTLWLDGHEYPVSEHQIFTIPAHIPSYYEASNNNPWNYIWIRFNGFKIKNLLDKAGVTKETPVFTSTISSSEPEQYLLDILHHHEEEYACIGNVYRLFQYMINTSANKPKSDQTAKSYLGYIHTAINYIAKKYSEPIRVQEIADYCGLNRSYLTRQFKLATNYTLHDYLILYRINKSKELLNTSDMPIQHIAYSVGYSDYFTFSKLFKRETGLSPSHYRRNKKNDPILR